MDLVWHTDDAVKVLARQFTRGRFSVLVEMEARLNPLIWLMSPCCGEMLSYSDRELVPAGFFRCSDCFSPSPYPKSGEPWALNGAIAAVVLEPWCRFHFDPLNAVFAAQALHRQMEEFWLEANERSGR